MSFGIPVRHIHGAVRPSCVTSVIPEPEVHLFQEGEQTLDWGGSESVIQSYQANAYRGCF